MLLSYCYNIKDKFCVKISYSYLKKKKKSYGCVKNDMLYSDNAKIVNTRLTISMSLYNWHETGLDRISLALVWKNMSRIFLRFQSKPFGLSCTLFKDTPKIGVGVYRTPLKFSKWPNCILICLADQRKTKVAKYYKLVVLLKKFVHEKCLWNNVWGMLNLYLTVFIRCGFREEDL